MIKEFNNRFIYIIFGKKKMKVVILICVHDYNKKKSIDAEQRNRKKSDDS